MFDIGGWEFLLIIVLALLIIGPKDLPLAIRTITQWIRKARSLAQEFQYNLDDIVTQAEIDKVKTDAFVPLADMLNHKRPRETTWVRGEARGEGSSSSRWDSSCGAT